MNRLFSVKLFSRSFCWLFFSAFILFSSNTTFCCKQNYNFFIIHKNIYARRNNFSAHCFRGILIQKENCILIVEILINCVIDKHDFVFLFFANQPHPNDEKNCCFLSTFNDSCFFFSSIIFNRAERSMWWINLNLFYKKEDDTRHRI